MSQGELAREAGCAIYTVSRLERGLQEPSWPLVLAMATALNVEVTALVVTKTKRKQKE